MDHLGPILALTLLYASIAGLVLFAFMGASKRGDEAADNLADRLLHMDVRLADLLDSFHPGQQ